MTNTDVRQRLLGGKGLIALLALLSAFVPLSMDLYLPALPDMATYFKASEGMVNLTLILFFVFFAAGILLWGPLSDRYGRKPVLLVGLAIYVAASVLCASATSIDQLILSRICQAIGGSAASAVATAIVKDVYRSSEREWILAIVQSMVMISPALAPVLGAFLLAFTSWQGVFWALAAIGLAALAGSAAYEETIARRSAVTLPQSLGRLGVVLKNPGFFSLLILFTMTSVSTMAYVASSSYVFQAGFGMSAQAYSFYFAINGIGLLLGPMLYVRLAARFDRDAIVRSCFAAIAVSGVLVFFLGGTGPLAFALCVLPGTVAGVCSRPPGTNLMLEQQAEDTGSASSLMGCVQTIMGTVGMLLVSVDPGDIIRALGIIIAVTGVMTSLLWLVIADRPFVRRIPEEAAHGR